MCFSGGKVILHVPLLTCKAVLVDSVLFSRVKVIFHLTLLTCEAVLVDSVLQWREGYIACTFTYL